MTFCGFFFKKRGLVHAPIVTTDHSVVCDVLHVNVFAISFCSELFLHRPVEAVE